MSDDEVEEVSLVVVRWCEYFKYSGSEQEQTLNKWGILGGITSASAPAPCSPRAPRFFYLYSFSE